MEIRLGRTGESRRMEGGGGEGGAGRRKRWTDKKKSEDPATKMRVKSIRLLTDLKLVEF